MMLKKMLFLMVSVLLGLSSGCAGVSNNNVGSGHTSGQAMVDLGNGVLKDAASGLMWQAEKGPVFTNVEDAKKYVAGLQLNGFSDWRLPSIYELYDFNFAFDFKDTGDISVDRKGAYWSASEEDGSGVGAWEVGDQCEVERNYVKYAKGRVRAVRP